ncbi:MAG: hypothetical protein ACR2OE_09490 [Thermomicrobiales bacterium]
MSITTNLIAILNADAALVALLPGGIYSEPLSPKDPVTGAAWQANPMTGVKRLKPALVLLEPQEVDAPLGLNPERRLDVDQWPECYLYAERRDIAATFDPADQRVMELLHGRRIGNADISATGYRARPLNADELPGDVWNTFRRYRVQTVRHIAGV